MFYKRKKVDVSTIKQSEDRFTRVDYSRLSIDAASGIRGVADNMHDSR